jgi:hypothetical protein
MGCEPGAGVWGRGILSEAEEVCWGIDVVPGGAEGGREAEAGGLAEAMGEGVFSGPFDLIEQAGG